MECALSIINDGGRRVGLPEASVIFDLGLKIKYIKPELNNEPYQDFLTFFEIARSYYLFS